MFLKNRLRKNEGFWNRNSRKVEDDGRGYKCPGTNRLMYEEFDFGINELIFDFEFIAETLIQRRSLLNFESQSRVCFDFGISID